jgi:hypothetical protein
MLESGVAAAVGWRTFHNASSVMRRLVLACLFTLLQISVAPAHAADKIDPYICPGASEGSGLDCFLEAVVQTYTMCRQVKSIEVIEFGLQGAQEGVNGAKTDSCIEKHKLSVAVPYQAALRQAGPRSDTGDRVRKLHDHWLQSLANLIPAPEDTDDGYKQRVVRPYGEFNDEIKAIRVAQAEPGTKPVIARTNMRKSKVKAGAVDTAAAAGGVHPAAAKKPARKSRAATNAAAVNTAPHTAP